MKKDVRCRVERRGVTKKEKDSFTEPTTEQGLGIGEVLLELGID